MTVVSFRRAITYGLSALLVFSGIATGASPASASTSTATPSSIASPTTTSRHLVTAGNGWAVYGDGVSRGVAQASIPASATTEQALTAASTLGAGTWCGWSHCSLIVYRGTTRSIANSVARYQNASTAAIAGAFAVACLPIGGVGAVVCGAIGGVAGGYAIDQFIYARDHNMCISIDFIPSPVPPLFSSVYNVRPLNDSNCKN